MLKRGETKLPVNKILALAEALEVDPAPLIRLALHDYMPNPAEAIEQALGHIATMYEYEFLLQPWRLATVDRDPAPTPALAAGIRRLLLSRISQTRIGSVVGLAAIDGP